MLKATAGGGGRGIRVVASRRGLADAYERTSQEALRAFGSGVVFLERLVTGARHVEVQVIADGQGTAWALGVRDCSVQRRNQKVIEESASPVLAPEQAAELKASAERLALAVGYRGAATVEFLYHPGEKLFAFLEVNTRLQVEHPITEITTGTDLVKAAAARGRRAAGWRAPGRASAGTPSRPGSTPRTPTATSRPRPAASPGWCCPPGPGIRVDTGVSEGDTIPADFDSMIAKIIAYGRDRDEALGRLRRAMAETTVIIEGGATNKSFVLDLLDQPEVIDAQRRHRLDRPGPRRGPAWSRTGTPASRWPRPRSRRTRTRSRSSGSGCCPPRTAAARRCSTRAAAPLDLKLRGASYRVTRRPGRRAAVPGRHRGGRRRPHRPTSRSSGSTSTAAGSWSTAAGSGWSPARTGRSTWSRSTASRTGSAGTRAASSARPRPRWSSPPRWRSATRSRRARRSSCWRA